MLGYTTFTSSEDFQQWQTNNTYQIVSITPLLLSASAEASRSGTHTSIDMHITIFVTYFV